MTTPLATKYRPQQFSDLIGQDLIAAVLSEVVSSDRVPPGFLFSGPSGTGKTSAARILAKALGGSEVIEVDAASHRGIDNVRSIASTLQYASSSPYRVVIFDEAHNLTSEAFDALLKTLEEPPQGSVFILVTTAPDSVKATVRDRLVEFEFRAVSDDAILSRLSAVVDAEGFDVSADLASAIVDRSHGSVRRALMLLEQIDMAKVSTRLQFEAMTGDRDYAPALVEKLIHGTYAEVSDYLSTVLSAASSPLVVIEKITLLFRDLLAIRSGAADKDTPGWGRRKDLAWATSQDQIMACMRLLWDCRTRLKSAETRRAELELVVALLFELLNVSNTDTPAPNPGVSSEGTLEDDEVMTLSDLHR